MPLCPRALGATQGCLKALALGRSTEGAPLLCTPTPTPHTEKAARSAWWPVPGSRASGGCGPFPAEDASATGAQRPESRIPQCPAAPGKPLLSRPCQGPWQSQIWGSPWAQHLVFFGMDRPPAPCLGEGIWRTLPLPQGINEKDWKLGSECKYNHLRLSFWPNNLPRLKCKCGMLTSLGTTTIKEVKLSS